MSEPGSCEASTAVPAATRARRGVLRRFRRAEGGALAVEFALIAPFFFGLLFGIIEIALTFWSTQVLETAVSNASRQIYTGAFQSTSGNDPSQSGFDAEVALRNFKNLVCGNVTAVFNCQRLISVDVRAIHATSTNPDPAWTAPSPPVTNGAYDPSSFSYDPPKKNEICIVRAAMEYPVYVNLLGYATGLRSGNRLVMASFAFRAEPY